jgi:hypothetical protein
MDSKLEMSLGLDSKYHVVIACTILRSPAIWIVAFGPPLKILLHFPFTSLIRVFVELDWVNSEASKLFLCPKDGSVQVLPLSDGEHIRANSPLSFAAREIQKRLDSKGERKETVCLYHRMWWVMVWFTRYHTSSTLGGDVCRKGEKRVSRCTWMTRCGEEMAESWRGKRFNRWVSEFCLRAAIRPTQTSIKGSPHWRFAMLMCFNHLQHQGYSETTQPLS